MALAERIDSPGHQGVEVSEPASGFAKHWFVDLLACPDCGNDLLVDHRIHCAECSYSTSADGVVEIMPVSPRPLNVDLSRTLFKYPDEVLKSVDLSEPENTYDGPDAIRDSSLLMSEMSRHLDKGSLVLDLGCGPKDQADPLGYLGYEYVGVDYSDTKADFLADAHALPFKSASFDCVMSYAVLEHLHNPIVSLHEIDRVLKPGGVYIGTVSQGEPFHASYFHHTAWGVISLVSTVPGLEIKRVWDSGDTLGALSRMGRYPRVVKSMLSLVSKIHSSMPWLAPRRMKWTAAERRLDSLHRAGAVCFMIQKSA